MKYGENVEYTRNYMEYQLSLAEALSEFFLVSHENLSFF